MSIEFFRPESQRPLDVDGYEIDSATREIAEIDTWFASQADVAWLNENPILPPIAGGSPEPYIPTAADWADYEAFCREVDERYELARMERLEDECRLRFG
jgi:hypothetical protein